jgi:flavorubredoxin
MKIHTISSNIYVLHSDVVNHPLFEGFWPIPDGVTLNSYLVRGRKAALIDLTADWQEAVDLLKKQLSELGEKARFDYLILNHLEPDHTGYLPEFIRQNPEVEIYATAKGCALVKNFLKVGSEITLHEVKTGDKLDLGDGTELSFYEIPNVHWPETMATFEPKSGTLFSCDAFGGYGKTGDRIFDDEFSDSEQVFYEEERLRYYATIVASFSTFVTRAIEKLCSADIDIKVVAPSHGIVWRAHPETAIERYRRYAEYNTTGTGEREVCVISGSMYGNTRKAAEAVVRGIKKAAAAAGEDIPVTILPVPETDVSRVLAAAYKAEALVISAPTYEYKLYPPMAYILDLFTRKHYNNKKVLRIGSWGWIGGAKKEYEERTAGLKWEQMEQYEWQGIPGEKEFIDLEKRGQQLYAML